jgi:hypothetical protein
MINRQLKTLLLGAILSGFAVAAMAQDSDNGRRAIPDARNPSKLDAQPMAAADAPNARLAGLVRRDLTVVRNKNIHNVTRPDVGVYCILPRAAAGITPSTAVIVLTPEYYYSTVNSILVQWASRGSGCPSNRIGVYTLADSNGDGRYTFSNAVSFSIVVP